MCKAPVTAELGFRVGGSGQATVLPLPVSIQRNVADIPSEVSVQENDSIQKHKFIAA